MLKAAQTPPRDTISHIELASESHARCNPAIEAEKQAAMRDLLASNTFRLCNREGGPWHVRLGLAAHSMNLRIHDEGNSHDPSEIVVGLTPFRRLIKDYFMLCESYTAASNEDNTSRLETIDMARRGLHDEGASLLRERLRLAIELDHATARALFTLLCIMHIGMRAPW